MVFILTKRERKKKGKEKNKIKQSARQKKRKKEKKFERKFFFKEKKSRLSGFCFQSSGDQKKVFGPLYKKKRFQFHKFNHVTGR
jgi:hypothetical protein